MEIQVPGPDPETPVKNATAHVWPLLLLSLALVVAIVVLVLFGHEPDGRVYDLLMATGGAVAGVTWARK